MAPWIVPSAQLRSPIQTRFDYEIRKNLATNWKNFPSSEIGSLATLHPGRSSFTEHERCGVDYGAKDGEEKLG
jgi:hypothetical protein